MNKVKLFLLIIVSVLFSCNNSELDTAKTKYEESKCKADFASFLLENGTNIMVLGKRLGLNKELEQFKRIQSDSTIGCDSIKKAWTKFSDLVEVKSK